jgi:eukaryotic-like serine/threonine-protein kinase
MKKPLTDKMIDGLREAASFPDFSGTRYSIIRKIGSGGMGTIYLAEDCTLERNVAVKVSDLAPSPDLAARMQQESRLIAMLEHPGIVPVHDAGQLSDGRLFYAMKYVQGESLDKHARKLKSTLDCVQLVLRISDAIAFAHAHRVIHRDLKPENIMVGPFGDVLVMDFGLACLRGQDRQPPAGPLATAYNGGNVAASPTDTAHGTVMGTPGFMAPEQARGDVHLVDAMSDIYAIGAILNYLLTRGLPNDSIPRPNGSIDSGVSQDESYSAIPRPLRAICRKAMAEDRRVRYRQVKDLSTDLVSFVEGLPVSAYQERMWERAARLASKYRVALVLILAYLLMRALLIIFFRA